MEKFELAVMDNIKNSFEDLFAAEKKVASYVLENMKEVVMLNISDLAQKSNTSEATIVRTCKHLGYDGYYQMRLLISRDVGKYRIISDDSESMNSSQKIFDFHSERISLLSESISMDTLVQMGRILLNGRVIHIVGVGNTVPVVMDLGFRLERCGVACTYSMLPEHFFNHIALGSSDDVVVAISRSGASTQVIRAVEIAHKKKMKSIIITGELNKQLTANADCIAQIVETKHDSTMTIKPDSHLLEFALNDAILYVVRNFNAMIKDKNQDQIANKTDDIGVLLSEFKL